MAQEEANLTETPQVSKPAENQEDAKLSEILGEALKTADGEGLTVGEILDRVADRGFGLVLVLLSLPTMIPILPPGASAVVGVLYAIVGIQLLVGAHQPWMPKWVRKYKLSPKVIAGLSASGIRWIRKAEHLSRPRWTLMRSQLALRVLGLIIIAIGIVLFLPLPFLNTLPGLAMLVMGIGLANLDGIFIFVAATISVALVLVAVFFGHLLIELYHWIKNRLFATA
jgi:hypothetical protein